MDGTEKSVDPSASQIQASKIHSSKVNISVNLTFTYSFSYLNML